MRPRVTTDKFYGSVGQSTNSIPAFLQNPACFCFPDRISDKKNNVKINHMSKFAALIVITFPDFPS